MPTSLGGKLLVSFLVVLAAMTTFVVAGRFVATEIIHNQQQRQLDELSQLALRRAEAVISHATETLLIFSSDTGLDCRPSSLQAARLDVYRGGPLKDIRVVSPSGSVLCSAFTETLEFDLGTVSREEMMPLGQRGYSVFPVEQFFGTAMGIMLDLGERGGVQAIISAGGPALDVLPQQLREQGHVVLRMADWRMIARADSSPGDLSEPVRTTSHASDIYPIATDIAVAESALADWNTELYRPVMFWAVVLGAAFGVITVRAMLRPRTKLSELDQAIAAGEFVPYFQPIFDLNTGEFRSAEVLARQVCRDGRVLAPAHFIDLAEQTGRIRPMTWQIMGKALRQAAPFLKDNPDFYLSFNITPDHFVSEDFADKLRAFVLSSGAAPRNVGIEITERQAFDDTDAAASVVATLRKYGFHVAIDDVGIGHSGLSQIQSLGADTVKIDKFFVDSISLDTSSNIVVEMLVRLARDKGMSIIAEGVETEQQVAALTACGVSLGQGYLVARPMPFDAFMERLGYSVPDKGGRAPARRLAESGVRVA